MRDRGPGHFPRSTEPDEWFDEAEKWGRNLAKVGRRKSGDSVEAAAVVTQVREVPEDTNKRRRDSGRCVLLLCGVAGCERV